MDVSSHRVIWRNKRLLQEGGTYVVYHQSAILIIVLIGLTAMASWQSWKAFNEVRAARFQSGQVSEEYVSRTNKSALDAQSATEDLATRAQSLQVRVERFMQDVATG